MINEASELDSLNKEDKAKIENAIECLMKASGRSRQDVLRLIIQMLELEVAVKDKKKAKETSQKYFPY